MKPRIELILLVSGCAGAVTDAGDGAGGFFRVTGPVDPAVAVTGVETLAAIAWVWADQGALCARGDFVPFEPQVHQYAVWIGGPPQPQPSDDVCVVAPTDLPSPTAYGVLILVEPTPGEEPTLAVDPSGLLDWLAVGGAGLPDAVQATAGSVAGVAAEHALLVGAGEEAPSGQWCRFANLIDGLTLYSDRATSCGGWEPLAPAGTRTDFQGVGIVPL